MLETLLHSIAGGMLAVLATARVEQIAWGFLRLVGIIVLAVAVGPAVWLVRQQGVGWVSAGGFVTAAFASLAIVIAPLAGRKPAMYRVVCGLGGAIGLAAASLSALAALPEGASQTVVAVAAFAQALSGLMLGSITLAWLLGHAYLTATSMTIAPLQHFSRMLSWTVAARLVFLAGSFLFAWLVVDLPVAARLADAWLIAILRIGVGLAGVAVFAYLVADCVRLRATQSATGILYFGSLMAYVGELASQPLLRELAWPL